ncbi:DUF6515 family protein [Echinicola salinicaeni]|uniref:DUF6515 family protein n=1 Tax=Echinicola salinicaeni TaxID=2762757 RepID=UPI001E5C76CC|nr:DUF6515 family protein [Echinicola salinicaeni]
MLIPDSLTAQRLRHAPSRGGVQSRPTSGRSINGGAQKSRQRPNFNNTRRPQSRPSQARPNTSRPTSRPSYNRPSNSRPSTTRPSTNRPNYENRPNHSRPVNHPRPSVNNRVNIRRSTVVIRNPRPYYRPPYSYGRYRYYCYRPYYYHPFRPYYWGPAWHPWGFFVASLAATAIVISIENQRYHYDNGVYYVQSNNGYTVVEPPVGATVQTLPKETTTVVVNETTNNYYYGGTYYEKTDEGYTVVPPTAGTIVENLPEGAEEVKIGHQTYVQYGETYYQPIQLDGKNMYEVVQVEEEEN